MKKIFVFVISALTLASCNMDFISSDAMTSEKLKEDPSSAVFTTDGLYSLLQDNLAYKGQSGGESGNYYIRHYFQLTELRGDNVTVSGTTEDPFIFPYAYEDIPTTKNIYYTWWIAYKIINATNANIAAIVPGTSGDSDHLLGENYFFRALAHFHMVTLFAMPYVCGRDNPGVVLRIGTDNSVTTRASVGDVYDAIVEDLKTAISFMEQVPSRGDKSYVSQNAAKALLSRVYLYMGDEHLQECLDLCNDLMANAPSVVTEGYDFADYPTHTYNHDETIWCLRLDENHDFAKADHAEASIASMYLEDGQGWGEHYWSDILIDLFQRYPEDQRFAAYFRMNGLTNDGKMMVTFPYKTKASNNYCSSYVVHGLRPDTDGAYSFQFNNVTYKAVPTEVNTYTQYIVTGIDFVTGETGASKTSRVFVRPDVNNTKGVRENGGDYVIYYNTKFSYQDGKPMMTSPVFLRWGEVVLNRAEANAKLGNDQPALDDVNTIRLRAGLPETAKMTVDNYEERGYDSILDVVLDERRMELCFEGHRAFDVYRNKKKLDRRFVGFHSFEEIDYTDKRIALLIPADEINTSHIDQNPR